MEGIAERSKIATVVKKKTNWYKVFLAMRSYGTVANDKILASSRLDVLRRQFASEAGRYADMPIW